MHCYIHIPFCKRKCRYCDFFSMRCDASLLETYVDRLEQQIRRQCESECIESVYFGGGTPSLLAPLYVGRLLEALGEKGRFCADAEITLEANPESITKETLLGYRACGVNRLSVGVQSFDDAVLRALGRVHDGKTARKALDAAQEVFFAVNADLMFALPLQTKQMLLEDIEEILLREIVHMSLYALTLREDAVLQKMLKEGRYAVCGEDEERAMYHEAAALMQEHGYVHYEISNFAKPSFSCRHNRNTWRMGQYRGFGMAAASFVNGQRSMGTRSLKTYLQNEDFGVCKDEPLSPKERAMEALMLALRTREGICFETFFRRYGVKLFDTHRALLRFLEENGFIRLTAQGFFLSAKGMDFLDRIILAFWCMQDTI